MSRFVFRFAAPTALLASSLFACGSSTENPLGSGGAPATGGAPISSGGAASGGAATGGSAPASGGALNSGGSSTGGSPSSSGGAGPSTGGAEAGGSPSAGGSDGTGGSAPSGGSSNQDLLFFSDFESDAVGKIPSTGNASWTTTLPTTYDTHGGIVEVQSGTGHSGTKFVYVKKSNEGQSFLQLIDPAVFPFSGSKVHVRAFIKVSEWPTNHVSWMEVGSTTNEQSEMRFGAHQGVLQVNHYPGDQDQIADGVTFNVNEWACIEYSYEPGTKTMMVWLNDEPIPALTVDGSFDRGGAFDPAPPIAAIRFGTEIAATEAYFDDIAVSTAPIGCN